MDKYVFVANANNQIGNEVVKKLISENFIVFAGDISYENKKFGNLIYVNLDTSSYKSLEAAKRYIQKYTSRISAIINLSKYITFSSLIECSEEEILKSIEINFMSAFRTNQVLWDILEQRSGKIIHDCSDVSIYELVPFNGVYSIAKSLLKNYNDVLRRELKDKGVSVIRVHTGLIKDGNYETITDKYHIASEKSKLFFGEMSRFINLNISKNALVNLYEYCDFLVKVVKSKNLKKVYYFNVNKKLRFISRLPNSLKDMYFKSYQK